MENLRVRTIRAHTYRGRRLPGSEYYMDNEKHVKLFIALKKVRRVEPEPAKKAAAPKKAPISKRVEPKSKPKKQEKGTYERKDIAKSPTIKSGARVKNENTKKD